MNQPTEAFLIELRNLCRAHGVDFSADLNCVSFTSTDESRQLAAALGMYDGIEANFEDLSDLEYQLMEARDVRLRRSIAAARGKPDPTH